MRAVKGWNSTARQSDRYGARTDARRLFCQTFDPISVVDVVMSTAPSVDKYPMDKEPYAPNRMHNVGAKLCNLFDLYQSNR